MAISFSSGNYDYLKRYPYSKTYCENSSHCVLIDSLYRRMNYRKTISNRQRILSDGVVIVFNKIPYQDLYEAFFLFRSKFGSRYFAKNEDRKYAISNKRYDRSYHLKSHFNFKYDFYKSDWCFIKNTLRSRNK